MNKELHISRILDYNDVPQLLIAEDIVRTKYIAILVEENGAHLHYITTAISSDRLAKYVAGKIDLRLIFKEPEIRGYWFSIRDISSNEITAEAQDLTELPEQYLPESDYYFQTELPENEVITSEIMDKDNVIIHLALDDGKGDNGIKANVLGDASVLYQSLLTHSFKKAIAQNVGLTAEQKRAFSIPRNSELRAFATSPGSFNIHFYSTSNKDLFGHHFIEIALTKLDELIFPDLNDTQIIDKLRSIKGHPVNAYKKLMAQIIKEGISIKYKWGSPSTQEVHTRIITKEFAERVIEIINQREELSEEIKEFQGYMLGADSTTGNWRLACIDGTEITGESENDLLKNVTIETVLYKIRCNEIIEVQTVSEAEKTKYILETIIEI